VKALGKDRVLGLLMPERDSSPDSLRLGKLSADSLGMPWALEDITATLEGVGCYRRRDDAIRSVIPEYGHGYQCKIALAEGSAYAMQSVVVRAPDGSEKSARLTLEAYRGIVAATSFKQRVRKMMEYYHADLHHYAVIGTPNRLEYDQGFFVKNGDGAADLKPIAHLYKGQVYQLARVLGVPEEIQKRPPTTDTFPMEQTQEEFYFSLPLAKFDRCLYGRIHNIAPEQLAAQPGCELTADEVAARRRSRRRLQADRQPARRHPLPAPRAAAGRGRLHRPARLGAKNPGQTTVSEKRGRTPISGRSVQPAVQLA
jgi:NAD+ synthase